MEPIVLILLATSDALKFSSLDAWFIIAMFVVGIVKGLIAWLDG